MNKTGKIIFTLLGVCLGAGLVVLGLNYAPQLGLFSSEQNDPNKLPMQDSGDLMPETYSGITFQDLAKLGLDAAGGDQYLADNLPECQFPALQTQEAIVIDEVVKNCSSQEKVGQIPDGLGGACFDWLAYDQAGDRILAMNVRDCHYGIEPQEALQRWVETTFLCKDTSDPEDQNFGTLFQESDMNSESAMHNAQVGNKVIALKKALKSWLLTNTISDVFNLASLYCSENDPDCKAVYDVGSRADEAGNYFVAGERTDLAGKVVYAINDKLYLPWEMQGDIPSWISTPNQKWTSPWLFAGVKDGKIIVKKMKDYVSTGKELPDYKFESKYTLETCEINL